MTTPDSEQREGEGEGEGEGEKEGGKGRGIYCEIEDKTMRMGAREALRSLNSINQSIF